jgi:aryl-alcohol dehydrogenase-like predicted oxidoreductase
MFEGKIRNFLQGEGQVKMNSIKALAELAQKGTRYSSFPYNLVFDKILLSFISELNCTVTHLALAWLAKNPNTSTVILGASKPEQVLDNLKALEVLPKLTPEIMDKIESILQNKPKPTVCIWYIESSEHLITKVFSLHLVDPNWI